MNKLTPIKKVEEIAVGKLRPHPKNTRKHSPAQVERIAASITEFGWTKPIITNAKHIILAGHGALEAAKLLKLATVPVLVRAGLTAAQERAYVIADNKIAELSTWDPALLALELKDLKGAGIDLSLTGFTTMEIDTLLAPKPTEQPPDPPAPALRKVATSRPGDIWICGAHRIMCGDCRDPKDVKRLIGEKKVNLAFTSPPYAEQREYDEASGFKPIPPDEYVEWFKPVAMLTKLHLAPDGSFFINIKPAVYELDTTLYVFDLVIAMARAWGWHWATEFCWERGGVPKKVTRRFKNQFEPIYQFALGEWKMRPEAVRVHSKDVPKPRGPGVGSTTWSGHQGGARPHVDPGRQGEPGYEWFGGHIMEGLAYPGNRLPTFTGSHEALGHAAAFPVGLPAWFIRAFSDAGDRIYEPFLGSGSTVIAAEQEKRVGLGMELSPLYVDMSVRRWQELTGKPAIHEQEKKQFDQIEKSRAKPGAARKARKA